MWGRRNKNREMAQEERETTEEEESYKVRSKCKKRWAEKKLGTARREQDGKKVEEKKKRGGRDR